MAKHVQIAISRTKEIGKALASTLWGPEHHKDFYVKFESIDLAHPIFINTMTSGWINEGFQWQLKVKKPKDGTFQMYPKIR